MKSRKFHCVFSDLYEDHWESLYRLAMSIVGDEDEAADIVQETFVNFWKLGERRAEIQSFKDYLFIMARNLAVKRFKRLLKKERILDVYVERLTTEDSSTEQRIDARSLSVIIDDEIAKLPKKMQKVFVLSRKEGLSHKEIGAEMNISEHTVKKQINNSLKLLNSRLVNEGLSL